MARIATKDVLDKFRWRVDIEGFTRSGFTAVEVPSVELKTKEYPEGGDHLHPKQIVDGASYKEITLLRGTTSDRSFRDWVQSPQQIVLANGTNVYDSYRRDLTITHLDRAGRPTRRYIVHNAIPVGFQPASDFQADSDDTMSLEKLVLKYESFEVQSISDNISDAFNVKDITKRLLRNF